MYGKLFVQMYDGTLATKGPWQALVTFQQFVILADKHGCVDMTAEAIARRTTIPLKIIKAGIAHLTEPDPHSRTPTEDGRRIVALSDSRPWGWRIVNYEHYRNLRSQEERRDYMRQYQRKRRANAAASTSVNNVSNVNQSSKQEAEKEADPSGTPCGAPLDPLWGHGLQILTTAGIKELGARAFIGSLLGDWEEGDVLAALREASGKAEPRAYARKVLASKPKKRKTPKGSEKVLADLRSRYGDGVRPSPDGKSFCAPGLNRQWRLDGEEKVSI